MNLKNLDTRRIALRKSIRQMRTEELNALWESLFTDHTHPWRELFRRFIDRNANDGFYIATANNRNHLVYCRVKERGIWFIPGVGIGLMQGKDLEDMKEIVDGLLLPAKKQRTDPLSPGSVENEIPSGTGARSGWAWGPPPP